MMLAISCAVVGICGVFLVGLALWLARKLNLRGLGLFSALLPLLQLAAAALSLALLAGVDPASLPQPGIRDILAVATAALLVVAAALDPLLVRRLLAAEEADTERAREELLHQQLAIQRQHLSDVSATLEQAKRIRKDMAREVGGVRDELAAGRDGQALARLEAMVGGLSPSHRRVCENPVADALLSLKRERCAELGIRCEMNVDAPANLPLSSTEICALFANVVDNAIHACELVPPERRSLELDAHEAGGYYVVRATNSCASADELAGPGHARKAREEGADENAGDAGVSEARGERSGAGIARPNARPQAPAAPQASSAPSTPASPLGPEARHPRRSPRTGNPRGTGLSEHGWGLVILQELAQRHAGRLETHRDDRPDAQDGPTFTTTVMLDLHA